MLRGRRFARDLGACPARVAWEIDKRNYKLLLGWEEKESGGRSTTKFRDDSCLLVCQPSSRTKTHCTKHRQMPHKHFRHCRDSFVQLSCAPQRAGPLHFLSASSPFPPTSTTVDLISSSAHTTQPHPPTSHAGTPARHRGQRQLEREQQQHQPRRPAGVQCGPACVGSIIVIIVIKGK